MPRSPGELGALFQSHSHPKVAGPHSYAIQLPRSFSTLPKTPIFSGECQAAPVEFERWSALAPDAGPQPSTPRKFFVSIR